MVTIAAGILLAVAVLAMLQRLPTIIAILFVLWLIGHFAST